ncbi:MAG: membrane-associated phospholipid phosphatase [Granulosicoccus sp.]|jgi:membrane-associated phospholipid phosphatase
MRALRVFFLFLLLGSKCFAQHKPHESPYKFNWKHEVAIASATIAYVGGGIALDYTRKGLTPAQIGSLNPSDINSFDRIALGQQGEREGLASDILLGTSFVLPAAVLAVKRCRADALILGLMWIEVAGLTLGTTEFVKSLVLRNRPYVYNTSLAVDQKTHRDARMSFFSGHTSATAAFSFFGAKVFSDYSDNNTHKALVWTGAVILPAVVGYLRVRAGKHFPTDVIAGYLVGGAIGYLVPFLHKRKPLIEGLTLAPYSSGRASLGVYAGYKF